MIDERRYFWRHEYGMTEEDDAIIRDRGIPTLDQEREARMERTIDTRDRLATMAAYRRAWRFRREKFGTVGLL
jgi:hypothetical protein